MQYSSELFDRETGELKVVSDGDWVTVTELGAINGVGRHRVRSILVAMDVLQLEGTGDHNRHRLTPWMVERGWGKRIERRHAVPFDVIGPEGRTWIADRWAAAVVEADSLKSALTSHAERSLEHFQIDRGRMGMTIEEQVSWLTDHFPALSQQDIALALSVSQQLVSRYMRTREEQRRVARGLRSQWSKALPRAA